MGTANHRKATVDDLEEILALNRKLFLYERQFDKTYDINWTNSQTGRDYFLSRIKGNSAIVLVTEVKGQIIGYIVMHLSTLPFRSVNPIAEIENMFVKERYRRKGIGTQLVKKSIILARETGAKRFRVGALANNNSAISFYRKLGFTDFEQILEMPA